MSSSEIADSGPSWTPAVALRSVKARTVKNSGANLV